MDERVPIATTQRLARSFLGASALVLLGLLFACTTLKTLGRGLLGMPLLALVDAGALLGFVFLISAVALATLECAHVVVQFTQRAGAGMWAIRQARAADCMALIFLLVTACGLSLFAFDAVRYAESTEAADLPVWPVLGLAIILLTVAGVGVARRIARASDGAGS